MNENKIEDRSKKTKKKKQAAIKVIDKKHAILAPNITKQG